MSDEDTAQMWAAIDRLLKVGASPAKVWEWARPLGVSLESIIERRDEIRQKGDGVNNDIEATEPCFRTPDGHTFPTRERAVKHVQLVDAAAAYDRAHKDLCAILLETQKTADGKPFEVTYYSRYWVIGWAGLSEPVIREITIRRGDVYIDEYDRGSIYVWEHDRDGRHVRRSYAMDDIYSDHRAAMRAWVEKVKEAAQHAVDAVDEAEKMARRAGAI